MSENGKVHLGPRQIVIGGRIIGSIDDVILDITEASADELKMMLEAQAIQLVKIGEG
jgi:hypothetical protein